MDLYLYARNLDFIFFCLYVYDSYMIFTKIFFRIILSACPGSWPWMDMAETLHLKGVHEASFSAEPSQLAWFDEE